jgi:hypothetical protein
MAVEHADLPDLCLRNTPLPFPLPCLHDFWIDNRFNAYPPETGKIIKRFPGKPEWEICPKDKVNLLMLSLVLTTPVDVANNPGNGVRIP